MSPGDPIRAPRMPPLTQHYSAYAGDVMDLKPQGRNDDAETLLIALVEATEDESRAQGGGAAPWYYEQLAIIRHKRRDYDGEIEVLERYAAMPHAPGCGPANLALTQPRQGNAPRRRRLMTIKRVIAYGGALGALAVSLAACGGSGQSQPTLRDAVAAVNATPLFQVGLKLGYQAGSTECAIVKTGSSSFEYDTWYRDGPGTGGRVWPFVISHGQAVNGNGIDKPAGWTPPGGSNCTVHADGTISLR